MRLSDLERMELMLLLYRRWLDNPSQRFCQVLVNVTDRIDPFYVTDQDLLAKLREGE